MRGRVYGRWWCIELRLTFAFGLIGLIGLIGACQSSELHPPSLNADHCKAISDWAEQNRERAFVFEWVHSKNSISMYASMSVTSGVNHEYDELTESDLELYGEIAQRTHYVTLRDFGAAIATCFDRPRRDRSILQDSSAEFRRSVIGDEFEMSVFWSQERCFPDRERRDTHHLGCLSVSVR